MPYFKDLNVQVLDPSGSALDEYGKQTIKKGNKGMSCYVQSETEMSFRISITPTMPFGYMVGGTIELHREEDEKIYRYPQQRDSAPWHLLATVRLDGREQAEKRAMVYLDEHNPYFKQDGTVTMEGRVMRDKDGIVRVHKWIFKEVGIDTLLDELNLDFTTEEDELQPREDLLISAMESLGANGLEEKEETCKAGLIEIAFERVTIEERARRGQWGEEYACDQAACGKTAKNISHKAGRDVNGKEVGDTTSFIHYTLVDEEGERFATFKFFYRSEEVLRKFDFPGFPPKMEQPDVNAMRKLVLSDGVGGKRNIHSNEDDWETDREGNDSPMQKKAKARKTSHVEVDSDGGPKNLANYGSYAEIDSDFDTDEEEDLHNMLEMDDRRRRLVKLEKQKEEKRWRLEKQDQNVEGEERSLTESEEQDEDKENVQHQPRGVSEGKKEVAHRKNVNQEDDEEEL